jgi:hypothetical protein
VVSSPLLFFLFLFSFRPAVQVMGLISSSMRPQCGGEEGRGREESADVRFPWGKRAFCSYSWSWGISALPPQSGRWRGPELGWRKVTFSWRRGGLVAAGKGAEHYHPFSLAACPPGSYKAKQGEGPCLPCPSNSRTTSPAASICTCHNNFYRADSDPADSACTSE